jgi:hypothetical protein
LSVNRFEILWPLLLAGLFWAVSSLAAEPLASLLACRALTDPAARLACFDRESGNLAGATATTTATASPPAAAGLPAAAGPPAAAGSAKENFGLSMVAVNRKEVAAGTRPPEIKNIDAHITSVSVAGTGVATFTLDNGQVWREITPDGDLLAKPGDGVKLSRGAFGSYWLQTPTRRGCKVTRVL